MSFLQTLLAFVLALGILVVIHELGHYAVARWCGVKVLRFSVGFGRPVLSRRFGRDHTEWVVGALPLGGYVSMLDERELPPGEVLDAHDTDRAFNRQPPLKRIAIVVAGPIANLILAVFLYSALFVAGVDEPRARLGEPSVGSLAASAELHDGDDIVAIAGTAVRSWADARWLLMRAAVDRVPVAIEVRDEAGLKSVHTLDLSTIDASAIESGFPSSVGLSLHTAATAIARVEAGSAADQAGLHSDDQLLSIDGAPIRSAHAAVDAIRVAAGRPLRLEIKRGADNLAVTVTPLPVETTDAAGKRSVVGRLGVEIGPRPDMVFVRDDPAHAVMRGVSRTWEMSVFSVRMLGRMLIGELSLKNLSGPVTIADYAGQSARLGVGAYLNFLALISISLGVLNLLPIPVLDGGHLLYYSAELIKGRPLSQRFIELSQRAGLGVLIALMAVALVNDLTRLLA